MASPMILDFLQYLPQMLFYFQVLLYLVLSYFFGNIIFIGVRRRIPGIVKHFAAIALGFIALIGAISLSSMLVFFNNEIMDLLQVNLMLNGVIASAILAACFYLITRSALRTDPAAVMERMRKRIGILEGILLREKIRPISKETLLHTAEHEIPGFTAEKAELNGTDWVVTLTKGKRTSTIAFGAFDGEMKYRDHKKTPEEYFREDPVKVASVVVAIAFIAFSLLAFRGFPEFGKEFGTMFGVDLTQMSKPLPEGCISPIALASSFNSANVPQYDNPEVKSMIEGESGLTIQWMYRVDREGSTYIMAFNAEFTKVCTATETRFCDCMDIPKFG